MKDALTIEKLKELIKLVELPVVNIEPLNKLIEAGGSMDNIHLVTSIKEFENINEFNTQHGKVKVMYSPILPKDISYLMNPPKQDDWLKPLFPIDRG